METAGDSSSSSVAYGVVTASPHHGIAVPSPEHQQPAPVTTYGNAASNGTIAAAVAPIQRRTTSFHALYTKHKTQKHKVWQDGRLVVQSCSVALHSASPPPGGGDPVLDVCTLLASEIQALRQGRLTDLESEKYLIQVEGPWQPSSRTHAVWPDRMTAVATATSVRASSVGMQKLLQRKFRKPAAKRPPPPSSGPPAFLQTRKRPLQPGELHRKYYGSTAGVCDGTTAPSMSHSLPHPPGHTPHVGPAHWPAAPPLPPRQVPRISSHPYNDHNHALVRNAALQEQQQSSSNLRAPLTINNETWTDTVSGAGAPHRPTTSGTTAATTTGPSSSRPSRNNFASNAFDPSGFYGEDEEEEETDDKHELGVAPTYDASPTEHSLGAHDWSATENNGVHENSSTSVTEEAVEAQKALTTDDLLELFGGDSASTATDPALTQKESESASFAGAPTSNVDQPCEANDILTLPPQPDSSDDEDDE